MSAEAIRMPKFGMTMKEGTVVEWPIGLGGHVDSGATVAIVETEKAEVEVESPIAGFLRHIYVEAGDTVACGTLLAVLTTAADEPFDAERFARRHCVSASAAATGAVAAADQAEASTSASPVSDVRRAAAAVAASATRPSAATGSAVGAGGKRAVAPAARALARKLGIDVQSLAGSGPGGRITRADVQARADEREALRTGADGVAVEVIVAGSGDRVLLLPGFGTDVSAYARQTPVLSDRYRVLAMNPRGVGASDAPAGDGYGPVTVAADAAAVLAGADSDEPAHVIGASMGAAAAVELALRHPQMVRSLTLITPALRITARLRTVLQAWCAAVEVGPKVAAIVLLPWLFSEATLGDERVRERSRRGLAAIVSRTAADVLGRYAAGFEKWASECKNDFAALEVPTLVLTAGSDLLIPDAAGEAAAIHAATVTEVPDSGHAVALEAPEAVNRAILDHLSARNSR